VGASITISVTFAPLLSGIASSLLTFWSNGGYTDVLLTRTAAGVIGTSSSSTPHSATSSSKTSSSSIIVTTSKSVPTSSKSVPDNSPSTNLASTTHSLPTTLMTSASQSAIATAPSGGGKSYSLVGCSLIQALAMPYPFYFPTTALLQSSAKSKSFPSPTSRPRQPSPTLRRIPR
jgi:hypothetical protein